MATLSIASLAMAADTASPSGLWRIVDDRTGQPKGFMRIYEQDGRFFGRLERTMDPRDQTKTCTACTDERKNQPLVGLVLMRNLRLEGGEYVGGDILDPETGSIYRCKFHLEQDGTRLVMRGFLGISLLGRSQTWVREP